MASTCEHCHKPLGLFARLKGERFCSDEHEEAFFRKYAEQSLERVLDSLSLGEESAGFSIGAPQPRSEEQPQPSQPENAGEPAAAPEPVSRDLHPNPLLEVGSSGEGLTEEERALLWKDRPSGKTNALERFRASLGPEAEEALPETDTGWPEGEAAEADFKESVPPPESAPPQRHAHLSTAEEALLRLGESLDGDATPSADRTETVSPGSSLDSGELPEDFDDRLASAERLLDPRLLGSAPALPPASDVESQTDAGVADDASEPKYPLAELSPPVDPRPQNTPWQLSPGEEALAPDVSPLLPQSLPPARTAWLSAPEPVVSSEPEPPSEPASPPTPVPDDAHQQPEPWAPAALSPEAAAADTATDEASVIDRVSFLESTGPVEEYPLAPPVALNLTPQKGLTSLRLGLGPMPSFSPLRIPSRRVRLHQVTFVPPLAPLSALPGLRWIPAESSPFSAAGASQFPANSMPLLPMLGSDSAVEGTRGGGVEFYAAPPAPPVRPDPVHEPRCLGPGSPAIPGSKPRLDAEPEMSWPPPVPRRAQGLGFGFPRQLDAFEPRISSTCRPQALRLTSLTSGNIPRLAAEPQMARTPVAPRRAGAIRAGFPPSGWVPPRARTLQSSLARPAGPAAQPTTEDLGWCSRLPATPQRVTDSGALRELSARHGTPRPVAAPPGLGHQTGLAPDAGLDSSAGAPLPLEPSAARQRRTAGIHLPLGPDIKPAPSRFPDAVRSRSAGNPPVPGRRSAASHRLGQPEPADALARLELAAPGPALRQPRVVTGVRGLPAPGPDSGAGVSGKRRVAARGADPAQPSILLAPREPVPSTLQPRPWQVSHTVPMRLGAGPVRGPVSAFTRIHLMKRLSPGAGLRGSSVRGSPLQAPRGTGTSAPLAAGLSNRARLAEPAGITGHQDRLRSVQPRDSHPDPTRCFVTGTAQWSGTLRGLTWIPGRAAGIPSQPGEGVSTTGYSQWERHSATRWPEVPVAATSLGQVAPIRHPEWPGIHAGSPLPAPDAYLALQAAGALRPGQPTLHAVTRLEGAPTGTPPGGALGVVAEPGELGPMPAVHWLEIAAPLAISYSGAAAGVAASSRSGLRRRAGLVRSGASVAFNGPFPAPAPQRPSPEPAIDAPEHPQAACGWLGLCLEDQVAHSKGPKAVGAVVATTPESGAGPAARRLAGGGANRRSPALLTVWPRIGYASGPMRPGRVRETLPQPPVGNEPPARVPAMATASEAAADRARSPGAAKDTRGALLHVPILVEAGDLLPVRFANPDEDLRFARQPDRYQPSPVGVPVPFRTPPAAFQRWPKVGRVTARTLANPGSSSSVASPVGPVRWDLAVDRGRQSWMAPPEEAPSGLERPVVQFPDAPHLPAQGIGGEQFSHQTESSVQSGETRLPEPASPYPDELDWIPGPIPSRLGTRSEGLGIRPRGGPGDRRPGSGGSSS